MNLRIGVAWKTKTLFTLSLALPAAGAWAKQRHLSLQEQVASAESVAIGEAVKGSEVVILKEERSPLPRGFCRVKVERMLLGEPPAGGTIYLYGRLEPEKPIEMCPPPLLVTHFSGGPHVILLKRAPAEVVEAVRKAAGELPKEKIPEAELDALVARLGDEDFSKREEVERRLVAEGESHLARLEQKAEEAADAETAARLRKILQALRGRADLRKVLEAGIYVPAVASRQAVHPADEETVKEVEALLARRLAEKPAR